MLGSVTRETLDDNSPLGVRGKRYIAMAKTAVVIIGILVAPFLANRAAVSEATAKTDAAVAAARAQAQTKPEAQTRKDESEASFQAILKWKIATDRRLLMIERAAARAAGRRPAQVVPKPFPTSTAEALQQIRGSLAASPVAPHPARLPPDGSAP
jgi:hypothetical protein